ncbi:hypothetical protein [Streptomyces erythrochromogenes]|uniref:hypothetical protein n=1 Tax=Streptomyces erythrochromogenes TaxID=285574 RepID=UPI003863BCF3|nr:hypothetical protein OG364_01735 [Streptomyces erythrochromogenes]
MHSTQPEPELPDRVPEKRDALTPDLPPAGPAAPDLPGTETRRPRRGSQDKDEDGRDKDEDGREDDHGHQPPAGPGNAKPQEPTD